MKTPAFLSMKEQPVKTIAPLMCMLLLLASGCSSKYDLLYSNRDQSVDFTRFKTFAWLADENTENTPYNNAIMESNMRSYFTHEFLARDLNLEKDRPDLLLQLVVGATEKEKTVQVATSSPPVDRSPYYYPNYGSSYWNHPATSPQNPYYNPYPNLYYYNQQTIPYPNYSYGYVNKVVPYTQSTITLNVIDRATNICIWTAVVQADLEDPRYLKEYLHPAVHTIMDTYPVKPVVAMKMPK